MKRKKTKQAGFEIKSDMKVLLVIESKSGADGLANRITLSSYVEEVMPDGTILIHVPVYRSYNYPLPRDEPILMYLLSKSRMYSMTARFLERVRHDGLMFARMGRCSPIKPDQRRDCYRLPCELPVLVERATVYKGRAEPHISYECRMVNFSDGGMLFAANEAFEIGEKITLTFNIGTDEAITAEVLRCERIGRLERLERSKQMEAVPIASIQNPVMESEAIAEIAETACETESNTYRNKIAVKFIHKCKKQKSRFYKFIALQQRKKIKEQMEQEALKLNN